MSCSEAIVSSFKDGINMYGELNENNFITKNSEQY
jgi:hypothetical protein